VLIKIFRDISLQPGDGGFKPIKVDKLQTKPKALQQFLTENGFAVFDGYYTFVAGSTDVRKVLGTLLSFRHDVKPLEREWVEENKTENINLSVSWIDAKEKKLRAEAAKTREKELADFAENKKYEKTIAQCTKAEAREDRRRRDILNGVIVGDNKELSEDIKNTAIIRATKSYDAVVQPRERVDGDDESASRDDDSDELNLIDRAVRTGDTDMHAIPAYYTSPSPVWAPKRIANIHSYSNSYRPASGVYPRYYTDGSAGAGHVLGGSRHSPEDTAANSTVALNSPRQVDT